jgi:hypothetical protein
MRRKIDTSPEGKLVSEHERRRDGPSRVDGAARHMMIQALDPARRASTPILHRFATEAAREETRLFCDGLVADRVEAEDCSVAAYGVNPQLRRGGRLTRVRFAPKSTDKRFGKADAAGPFSTRRQHM